jgi:hypothetical protein
MRKKRSRRTSKAACPALRRLLDDGVKFKLRIEKFAAEYRRQEANRLKAEAKKCCFWLLFARELQTGARRSVLAAAGRAM